MSAQELRSTFLFDSLDDDQLDELARLGEVVAFGPDEVVFAEGAPADHLWVLLEGRVQLTRRMHAEEVALAVMDRPGSWAGGLRAYGAGAAEAGYRGTGRAMEPSRCFRLTSEDLARVLTEWYPLPKHFLDGMFQTLRGIEALVRQRESLVSLGTLAAGLAHELNNPAAAAAQATSELRRRLDQITDALVALSGRAVVRELLDSAERRTPGDLDPLARSEAEEALGEELDRLDVPDPWRLAADLVDAGIDAAGAVELARAGGGRELAAVLGVIADLAVSRSLAAEVDEATRRISDLIAAVRGYSQLDRAPTQVVDLHDGLDATLRIMSHRLGPGISVVRDYATDLPGVECNPAELNQVWTNLLDNAVDAVDGTGTIRIVTRADGGSAVVEVVDDGPGMPPEVLTRAFEPFFTTKDVGRGSGLGLDVSRRIVESQRGRIDLESEPGRTCVRVRLPGGGSQPS